MNDDDVEKERSNASGERENPKWIRQKAGECGSCDKGAGCARNSGNEKWSMNK